MKADIDLELGDVEDMTEEELELILSKIAEHSSYKSFGDGRIRKPEKERVRVKYCRIATEAVSQRLEHLRQRRAQQLISDESEKNSGEMCVYLIGCEGLHKIGISSDPQHRMDQLKVANPFDLKLEAYSYVKDADSVERKYHQMYEMYNKRGEWFDFPPDVLEEVISSIENLSDDKREEQLTL